MHSTNAVPNYTQAESASHYERKTDLVSNFHFQLRVIHTRGHIRYIVHGAIRPMKDPSVSVIGFLELSGGYARLLVAIAAIRANKSHVFVIDCGNTNVELIDAVDNELHIGPSQLC
jgi:hypothetical protein